MNLNINKTLPYFVIGILLVFTLTVLVEIYDINTEMEELKTTIIKLQKVKQ